MRTRGRCSTFYKSKSCFLFSKGSKGFPVSSERVILCQHLPDAHCSRRHSLYVYHHVGDCTCFRLCYSRRNFHKHFPYVPRNPTTIQNVDFKLRPGLPSVRRKCLPPSLLNKDYLSALSRNENARLRLNSVGDPGRSKTFTASFRTILLPSPPTAPKHRRILASQHSASIRQRHAHTPPEAQRTEL